jgi:methyl-accepting chemotaxis protein WspA
MSSFSVRQRILTAFAVLLAVMLAAAAFAFTELASAQHEATSVLTDSLPGLYYSDQIVVTLVDNFAHTDSGIADQAPPVGRGGDGQIVADRAELEALIRKSEPLISQGRDVENFTAFKDLLAAYFKTQDEFSSARSDPMRARAIVADQLRPEFDKARAVIHNIADANEYDTKASIDQIEKSVATAKLGTLTGYAVALLFAVISGWALLRALRDVTKLVGQVQMSGIQVSTSATEIAATAKEQQATASEIFATTMEIGATSKEISASSKELLKTMGDVSSVSEQAAVLAGSGHASLSRMEETMTHVMEAAASINNKLGVLNEKAGDINQLVTTITKVADQTNLLSLNAAIEAEKAGESGRGFAVVAAEIRRLADQTGVATYDIEQMVKEVQSAISAGVMGMDKFSEEVRRGMKDVQQVGTQLSDIIQRVEALAPRYEQVNEGMQAQATGAEQISEALRQLTEAAQQTVESLRQSGLTIEELHHVSANLRGSVSSFQLA